MSFENREKTLRAQLHWIKIVVFENKLEQIYKNPSRWHNRPNLELSGRLISFQTKK
jgi:hypothetical protein